MSVSSVGTYLYHGDIPCQTQPAGADLTGKFGFFSKSVAGVTVLCGDGEKGMGPLMNEGILGDPVRSALGGTVAFVAGASIAADVYVAAMAGGAGKTAVAGNHVFGQNRFAVAAGEQGELAMVNLSPMP